MIPMKDHDQYEWAREEAKGSLRFFEKRTGQDTDEALLDAFVDLALRAYDNGWDDCLDCRCEKFPHMPTCTIVTRGRRR
jgi:hypothetical protein